jgi:hypothetical protein
MKSPAEIKARITGQMDSMLARPKMWTDTAIGLETHYLSNLGLVLFIDGILEADQQSIFRKWQWFAKKEVGYHTNEAVAAYLSQNGKLNDGWKELTDLLCRFSAIFDTIQKHLKE